MGASLLTEPMLPACPPQITATLAGKLMLEDASKLRLTRHNQYMQQPHRNPVKYRDPILTTLDRMLQHAQHLTDTLYYEVRTRLGAAVRGLPVCAVVMHCCLMLACDLTPSPCLHVTNPYPYLAEHLLASCKRCARSAHLHPHKPAVQRQHLTQQPVFRARSHQSGCREPLSDPHHRHLPCAQVLDLPLPQLEQLKTIRVSFHNDKTELVDTYTLRIPKAGSVKELLQELDRQLPQEHQGQQLRWAGGPAWGCGGAVQDMPWGARVHCLHRVFPLATIVARVARGRPHPPPSCHPAPTLSTLTLPQPSTVAHPLTHALPCSPPLPARLLEVYQGKIFKVVPGEENVDKMDDTYWVFRAEPVPADQQELQPGSKLITCFHYQVGRQGRSAGAWARVCTGRTLPEQPLLHPLHGCAGPSGAHQQHLPAHLPGPLHITPHTHAQPPMITTTC